MKILIFLFALFSFPLQYAIADDPEDISGGDLLIDQQSYLALDALKDEVSGDFRPLYKEILSSLAIEQPITFYLIEEFTAEEKNNQSNPPADRELSYGTAADLMVLMDLALESQEVNIQALTGFNTETKELQKNIVKAVFGNLNLPASNETISGYKPESQEQKTQYLGRVKHIIRPALNKRYQHFPKKNNQDYHQTFKSSVNRFINLFRTLSGIERVTLLGYFAENKYGAYMPIDDNPPLQLSSQFAPLGSAYIKFSSEERNKIKAAFGEQAHENTSNDILLRGNLKDANRRKTVLSLVINTLPETYVLDDVQKKIFTRIKKSIPGGEKAHNFINLILEAIKNRHEYKALADREDNSIEKAGENYRNLKKLVMAVINAVYKGEQEKIDYAEAFFVQNISDYSKHPAAPDTTVFLKTFLDTYTEHTDEAPPQEETDLSGDKLSSDEIAYLQARPDTSPEDSSQTSTTDLQLSNTTASIDTSNNDGAQPMDFNPNDIELGKPVVSQSINSQHLREALQGKKAIEGKADSFTDRYMIPYLTKLITQETLDPSTSLVDVIKTVEEEYEKEFGEVDKTIYSYQWLLIPSHKSDPKEAAQNCVTMLSKYPEYGDKLDLAWDYNSAVMVSQTTKVGIRTSKKHLCGMIFSKVIEQ